MKTPAFFFIEILESRIAPAAFIVTTLKDLTDANHDTGSLRDAILAADAAGGANSITFQKMVHGKAEPLVGTIKLLSDLPTITDGGLMITGPVSGKATGIVINGNGHSAIVANTGTGGLTMTDLTITHAVYSYGGGVFLNGSGSFSLTDVTISKNRATRSTGGTSYGGGLYIDGGTSVTISHSKITGNVAVGFHSYGSTKAGGAYGGGIFDRGNLMISDSVVSGNIAQGGSVKSGSTDENGGGGYGGGIYCSHTSGAAAVLTVQSSIISGNKVIGANGGAGGKGGSGSNGGSGASGGHASGGGIYGYNGQITVMESVISGNSTIAGKGGAGGAGGSTAKGGAGGNGGEASGGGIVNGGSHYNPRLTIETSTISGNTIAAGKGGAGGAAGGSHGTKGLNGEAGKASGGGVYSKDTLNITQSTISKNAASFGGGIFLGGSGTATIENSTIARNRAGDGGGIQVEDSPTVKIDNDTIAQNTAGSLGGGIDSFSSTPIEVISTIIAGNVAHTDTDISGAINASFDLIGKVTNGITFGTDTNNLKNENPLLGALGSHGGDTPTMLPSIKPGKLSPVIDAGSNPDSLTFDQRGDTRTLGNGVDIGAVEVQ